MANAAGIQSVPHLETWREDMFLSPAVLWGTFSLGFFHHQVSQIVGYGARGDFQSYSHIVKNHKNNEILHNMKLAITVWFPL